MRACEWNNSRQRTDVRLNQLYQSKAIALELEQENRELLLLRRSRMKEFLQAESEMFEAQLNAMGKAFCTDDR
jgi:hypothetical protein